MGGLVFAVLSAALGSAAAQPAAGPDSTGVADARSITWQSAFIIGCVARATPADTRPLDLRGDMPAELHLVLEGVQGGLPIYCSPVPLIRIDGRMIPERLVLHPVLSGLTDVEIHWVELRPTDVLGNWRRTRVIAADGRWSYELERFPGDPAPGMRPDWGTARFAACVAALDEKGEKVLLATNGWTKSPDWRNPESPPGFRVTRSDRGILLTDWAVGLARLPVDPRASDTHCQQRIALRPVDVVLAAYEISADVHLPTARSEPLDGDAWSWLFTSEHRGLLRLRGENSSAPLMAPDSRGVAWSPGMNAGPGLVQRGDVLLADDGIALLDSDDGDGWLSEGDFVLHALYGQLERGRLHQLPGRTLEILRTRSFAEVKEKLEEAGYYGPDRTAVFGPRLRRACREFQRDRDLEETGVPDETLLQNLQEFLARLRDPAAAGEAGTTP